MLSGDGWTRCALGHRHWGLFGAAGILVVRNDEVLLQLRSGHTHHGNTWSVPGGARHASESAVEAALREAQEEIGIDATDVRPFADVVDDHGGWSYTTVVARLRQSAPFLLNHESAEVRWVPVSAVQALELHPGFAVSWPSVVTAISAVDHPSA